MSFCTVDGKVFINWPLTASTNKLFYLIDSFEQILSFMYLFIQMPALLMMLIWRSVPTIFVTIIRRSPYKSVLNNISFHIQSTIDHSKLVRRILFIQNENVTHLYRHHFRNINSQCHESFRSLTISNPFPVQMYYYSVFVFVFAIVYPPFCRPKNNLLTQINNP